MSKPMSLTCVKVAVPSTPSASSAARTVTVTPSCQLPEFNVTFPGLTVTSELFDVIATLTVPGVPVLVDGLEASLILYVDVDPSVTSTIPSIGSRIASTSSLSSTVNVNVLNGPLYITRNREI